jgi:hypothetical protein
VAPAPDDSPSPVVTAAISAAAHDKLLYMPGQFDPLRHPDYYEKESKE